MSLDPPTSTRSPSSGIDTVRQPGSQGSMISVLPRLDSIPTLVTRLPNRSVARTSPRTDSGDSESASRGNGRRTSVSTAGPRSPGSAPARSRAAAGCEDVPPVKRGARRPVIIVRLERSRTRARRREASSAPALCLDVPPREDDTSRARCRGRPPWCRRERRPPPFARCPRPGRQRQGLTVSGGRNGSACQSRKAPVRMSPGGMSCVRSITCAPGAIRAMTALMTPTKTSWVPKSVRRATVGSPRRLTGRRSPPAP